MFLNEPTKRRFAEIERGFTLVELLVALTVLAVLTTLVLPVAEIQVRRAKEQELRRDLWQIRDAIDAYKRAYDEGRIERTSESSGYPPNLEILVEGVQDRRTPKHTKIYFLRRIPRNPFAHDPKLSDAQTWGQRSYDSDATEPAFDGDVYDVYSDSHEMGLNGIPYARW